MGWHIIRPTYLHRLVECLNLALADREYYYGDPRFTDVPLDWLLDRRRSRGGRRRCVTTEHSDKCRLGWS